MLNLLSNLEKLFDKSKDISLLFVRLVLAYGFLGPALSKIQGFNSVVMWFGNDLHIPFPWLNAFLATSVECLGVITLSLGLFTRLISLPLCMILFVAVLTVHGFETFSAAENGFEIPLYYLVMLFVLISTGAGKYSLDQILSRRGS